MLRFNVLRILFRISFLFVVSAKRDLHVKRRLKYKITKKKTFTYSLYMAIVVVVVNKIIKIKKKKKIKNKKKKK